MAEVISHSKKEGCGQWSIISTPRHTAGVSHGIVLGTFIFSCVSNYLPSMVNPEIGNVYR